MGTKVCRLSHGALFSSRVKLDVLLGIDNRIIKSLAWAQSLASADHDLSAPPVQKNFLVRLFLLIELKVISYTYFRQFFGPAGLFSVFWHGEQVCFCFLKKNLIKFLSNRWIIDQHYDHRSYKHVRRCRTWRHSWQRYRLLDLLLTISCWLGVIPFDFFIDVYTQVEVPVHMLQKVQS